MARKAPPSADDLLEVYTREHAEDKPLAERTWDYLLEGYKDNEVARLLKIPVEEVQGYIRERAETARQRILDGLAVDTLLELDRLDRMVRALWPGVLMGDTGVIDRVRAIGESRREILGLDAPAVRANLHLSAEVSAAALQRLSLPELQEYQRLSAKLDADTETAITGGAAPGVTPVLEARAVPLGRKGRRRS